MSIDDLPFTPRDVALNNNDKFEDFYDIGKEVGKYGFHYFYFNISISLQNFTLNFSF